VTRIWRWPLPVVLVDHVFPEVSVRQWVLSLPHRVRYLLARHPRLCREVRGVFARAVQSFYVRRAAALGSPGGRCGAVVQVQRFDSALRLDIHFHGLFLDGVFTGFEFRHPPSFQEATHLTEDEIAQMVRHIQALVFGHLRRRGYLDEAAVLVTDSEADLDELGTHHVAAIQGLIPFGPRSGQRTTLFGDPPLSPPGRVEKKLCADHQGYSLHAGIRIGGGKRNRLERLW
jgi:hypothetical protein